MGNIFFCPLYVKFFLQQSKKKMKCVNVFFALPIIVLAFFFVSLVFFVFNFFMNKGKKVMEETGEKRSSFYLFQNISIAIQRGNASCVLGTVPHSEGLEEIFEFVSTISQSGRRSQMEED